MSYVLLTVAGAAACICFYCLGRLHGAEENEPNSFWRGYKKGHHDGQVTAALRFRTPTYN